MSKRKMKYGYKRRRGFEIDFLTHGTEMKIQRRGRDLVLQVWVCLFSPHQHCFEEDYDFTHPRVMGAELEKEWQENTYIQEPDQTRVNISLFCIICFPLHVFVSLFSAVHPGLYFKWTGMTKGGWFGLHVFTSVKTLCRWVRNCFWRKEAVNPQSKVVSAWFEYWSVIQWFLHVSYDTACLIYYWELFLELLLMRPNKHTKRKDRLNSWESSANFGNDSLLYLSKASLWCSLVK